MKRLLCSTVLATVILGAFSFPSDSNPKADAPVQVVAPTLVAVTAADAKQQKNSIFGVGFDVNLSKNGTFIPAPAFVNTSASLGAGVGAGGNFLVPLVPFPLGLLFPNPPLNITVGFNANKNVSYALVAAAGNVSLEEASGWGWPQAPQVPPSPGTGWVAPTPPPTPPPTPAPTPPPSGWGWQPEPEPTPPPPSGWGWQPEPEPTPPPPNGWGWNPPEITGIGWAPEPPQTQPTTPGWGSKPESTQGWGWGWKNQPGQQRPQPVKKGVNGPDAPANGKPQILVAKPSSLAKPAPSSNDGAKPADASSSTFVSSVAHSSLSSELPSVEAPERIPVLETNVIAAAPAAAAVPTKPIQAPAAMQVFSKNNPNVKESSPVVVGKVKRHAGVRKPVILRIEDFEDVESQNEMSGPSAQEQAEHGHEISKEEMILMAMENSKNVLIATANAQPAVFLPSVSQLLEMSKPITVVGESDDSVVVDLRNAEFAQEGSKTGSKGKPESIESNGERGGRNKPRPYGMDKPSKNRPTLDSGMKDKAEQFGLPHYNSDLVQKEQYPLGFGSNNVLGIPMPGINWSSFANIFQNFMGSQHKKNSMGKSEAVAASSDLDKCVDDEEQSAVDEAIRSPIITAGLLCQSSGKSSCREACIGSGFAGGTCLGPHPTPGCLCKMPNHKDLGMILSPLKKISDDLTDEVSDSQACKKCACADSCKKSGSYTGFCIDKCYCAVPWYNKDAQI